jgi:Flp pilus assembly protein TadG
MLRRLFLLLALGFTLCSPSYAALTLQQIGDASGDPSWASRIKARLLQDAIAITTESAFTANHVARVSLAGKILQEPALWTSRFVVVVAGQSGPASANSLAAVTDSQINTAVDSVIDSFALNAQ